MRAIYAMSLATIGGLLVGLVGCSASGAASMGIFAGKNLAREDSHLQIKLDGQEAKQNKLKKAARGYARFEVDEPVDTAPTLRFEIEEPDKFGRITMVTVSIYQKFEADYSHQAEYTIVAENTNDPLAQMKPGVAYDLGDPPAGFKVLNLTGHEVDGIELIPGQEYMLTLTVRADKSETAQVYFETT